MASPSFRSTHVSPKPYSCCFPPHCMSNLVIASATIKNKSKINKYIILTQGEIQRYEIVRSVKRPAIKPNTNPTLILWCITLTQSQDIDQDMEDSNSPANNKRGQISLYQPSQQKKREVPPKMYMTNILTKNCG
jgi:hypothetical protein